MIVFKHKLNLKLKIDPKMRTFKNLLEIWKTWKKIWKNELLVNEQGRKQTVINKKVILKKIYYFILPNQLGFQNNETKIHKSKIWLTLTITV